jgi:hypothetical protein
MYILVMSVIQIVLYRIFLYISRTPTQAIHFTWYVGKVKQTHRHTFKIYLFAV